MTDLDGSVHWTWLNVKLNVVWNSNFVWNCGDHCCEIWNHHFSKLKGKKAFFKTERK